VSKKSSTRQARRKLAHASGRAGGYHALGVAKSQKIGATEQKHAENIAYIKAREVAEEGGRIEGLADDDRQRIPMRPR
jgi:hypothetical protein